MTPVQQAAIFEFLSLGSDMWGDIGTSLTCTETNVIAELMEAFGDHVGADVLRRAHAWGDDEGDDHFDLRSEMEVG